MKRPSLDPIASGSEPSCSLSEPKKSKRLHAGQKQYTKLREQSSESIEENLTDISIKDETQIDESLPTTFETIESSRESNKELNNNNMQDETSWLEQLVLKELKIEIPDLKEEEEIMAHVQGQASASSGGGSLSEEQWSPDGDSSVTCCETQTDHSGKE